MNSNINVLFFTQISLLKIQAFIIDIEQSTPIKY